MAKLVLDDVQNIYGNSVAAENNINSNSAKVEEAIENTLSRDGTGPNFMLDDLDMNSQQIINLADGVNPSDAATVGQVNAIGSPSVSVSDLTDVVLASGPVVGDVLLYNGSQWESQGLDALGGVNVLNDLQDVTVSAPQDQQVVGYNAANARWENITNPAGITDHGLMSGLTDDDHPQYLTQARGDTYYAKINVTMTGTSSITGGGTLAANRTFALVNDLAAPGASRYYGTSSTGVKGFYPLPSPTTDHGAMTGLSDDDHPQYFNQSRGDARYSLSTHTHAQYPSKNVADTINATWTFSTVPYVASAGAMLYHGDASNSSGKITVSGSAPSGGSDGDIWFVLA